MLVYVLEFIADPDDGWWTVGVFASPEKAMAKAAELRGSGDYMIVEWTVDDNKTGRGWYKSEDYTEWKAY